MQKRLMQVLVSIQPAKVAYAYFIKISLLFKLSKDLDRVDKERKEGLQKIQTMHSEIKDLKAKLSDFESNKAKEIKKLQDSLTGEFCPQEDTCE